MKMDKSSSIKIMMTEINRLNASIIEATDKKDSLLEFSLRSESVALMKHVKHMKGLDNLDIDELKFNTYLSENEAAIEKFPCHVQGAELMHGNMVD